ncbi:MAG: exosortase-dependent surface protein XDP2 [Cyanobacteria bacterium J06638_28]
MVKLLTMSRTFSKLVLTAGVAAGFMFVSSSNANASSFTSILSTDDTPNGDALLDSIELKSGTVIDDIIYVEGVSDLVNDEHDGGDTGAASADKGTEATTGVAVEDPTEAEILTNLSNNNLNNIVDTEDVGEFSMVIDFGEAIKSLMIWERGGNSKLGLQALDDDGNAISGVKVVDSADWQYSGFDILTTEIAKYKDVESQGVYSSVAKVGNLFGTNAEVSKIRIFSEEAFNGPDWKVAGTSVAVPEPATVLGLTALAGAFVAVRRRQADA